MSALTDEEREALYSPIGNEDAYPELPGVVADLIATHVAAERARVDAAWRARIRALAAEWGALDMGTGLIAEDPS